MELWRGQGRDHQTVLIILAVIAITSEKFVRGGLKAEDRSLATYLPLERLQRCNVTSIAAATGLSRETTRRRVAALIHDGTLTRTESGDLALPPSRVQQASAIQLIHRQLEAVVKFTNEALKDGVLIMR